MAQELCAERAIRYREEDVAAAIQAWTGKAGADVVFDTVGNANFATSFDHVAAYGTLLSSTMSDWPVGTNSKSEFLNIRIVFENVGLPQVAKDRAARCRQTKVLTDAGALFDAGDLRVVVGGRYPLSKAREAHRALETGAITGRIVLDIA